MGTWEHWNMGTLEHWTHFCHCEEQSDEAISILIFKQRENSEAT